MWLTEMLIFKCIFVLTVLQDTLGANEVESVININLDSTDDLRNDVNTRIALSAYLPGLISFLAPVLGVDPRWGSQEGFNAERDVSFYLYTKGSPEGREKIRFNSSKSLRASHFNPAHPTRIIIHGWFGSEYASIFYTLTPAYLKHGNYNVIVVDWGKGAIADYSSARNHVKSVGLALAKFVDFLHRETKTNYKKIYLIGFSMGAHIAGIAGKNVQGGRIPVIFGLDPALPLFSFENTDDRLTSNDANYVEVIHSNAGGYGFEQPIGHADFYVNYGKDQPGCLLAECHHFRAFKVFAESLSSRVGFWGKGCDTSVVNEMLKSKRCKRQTESMALMGGDSSKKNLTGAYYVVTNFRSPYAMGTLINK